MSDEPIDVYSDEHENLLSLNLEKLSAEVESGAFRARPLSTELVCDLHGRLFGGVRAHAGRCRSRGMGPVHLIILGTRSPANDEVPAKLAKILSEAERRTAHARDAGVADAVRIIIRTHVDLVQLQPFNDGNKRTARLVLNIMLVRLGLNAVAFAVPRKEYFAALEAGIHGDCTPLEDLVIELLATQLPANG